jgi:hypothetical protein
LTWATISHLNASEIPRARASKLGNGGLWTVESGSRFGNLHVNLIIEGQPDLFQPGRLDLSKFDDAQLWHQALPASDLRNVVAYISKREAFPLKTQYQGNLYGTWGTWRSVRQINFHPSASPLVHAASLEQEMHALGIQPPKNPSPPQPEKNPPSRDRLTPDQYREIALRSMPLLAKLIPK